MDSKVFGSAALDFVITAGTGFLALPPDAPISLRTLMVLLIGSAVATAKGVKTYHSTHPLKAEVSEKGSGPSPWPREGTRG